MQLIIEVDDYQLEHCKRHVRENYANLLEEAIANGKPVSEAQWILCPNGQRCSHCHRKLIERHNYKFCPNCGAIITGTVEQESDNEELL